MTTQNKCCTPRFGMFEAHHPECHTQKKSIREEFRSTLYKVITYPDLEVAMSAFDTALEAIAVEVEATKVDEFSGYGEIERRIQHAIVEGTATNIRSHKKEV